MTKVTLLYSWEKQLFLLWSLFTCKRKKNSWKKTIVYICGHNREKLIIEWTDDCRNESIFYAEFSVRVPRPDLAFISSVWMVNNFFLQFLHVLILGDPVKITTFISLLMTLQNNLALWTNALPSILLTRVDLYNFRFLNRIFQKKKIGSSLKKI